VTVRVILDGALLHASSFLCPEYSAPPTGQGPVRVVLWPWHGDEIPGRDGSCTINKGWPRWRTREGFKAAFETEAGRRLGKLRSGSHRDERAQELDLVRERTEDRLRRRGRGG
jgi:hypothetical protein